jgi:hypothetical protein
MNTLRKYLDILAEADAPAPTNPWTNDPVKAAAWEKLSPQMKAKIGGADPTDKIIISAMADGSGWGRAKGINDANPDGTPKVAAQTSAPQTNALGVAPVAQPAPLKTPSAGASADGNAGELAAQIPGAVNPALQPAPLKTPSAGASADGNAGEVPAQANVQSPAQSAQPAAPKNRDSMSFGQAFADARKGGEKTFTWKGKSYGTDLAKPKSQQPSGITTPPKQGAMPTPGNSAQPAAPTNNPWTAEETAQYNEISKRVQGAKTQGEKDMANAEMLAWSQRVGKRMGGMSGPTPTPAPADGAYAVTTTPEYKQLFATMNAAYQKSGAESPEYKKAAADLTALVNKNKPVSETVSFADDTVQRIVSLVHYR